MSYGRQHIPDMLQELFVNDSRKLAQTQTALIEQNYNLGNPQHGFLFHGEFCTNLPVKLQAQAEKKLLHTDLHSEGRAFFKEKALIKKEVECINQGLSVILSNSLNDQDIRDTLPDITIPLLPMRISSLPRTREPGYAFKANPIKSHDFDQICKLIGFYVANKLLY